MSHALKPAQQGGSGLGGLPTHRQFCQVCGSQHSGQHPTCDQLKAFVKTDLATTRDLIEGAVKQLPLVIELLNKHTRNRGENKREGGRQTVQISDLARCCVVRVAAA